MDPVPLLRCFDLDIDPYWLFAVEGVAGAGASVAG